MRGAAISMAAAGLAAAAYLPPVAAAPPTARVGGHPPSVVPFAPPPGLRAPTLEDRLSHFWADGQWCAVGCRANARPGWPLKPFNRQHPLRSALNELRTGTLHNGVDVQGRDGQEVYAIQSGRAKVPQATGANSRVRVGRFEYWHIVPAVKESQQVTAYSTVIGRIRERQGHVHLLETNRGQVLNPLRPGGRMIDPYVDRAPPVIGVPEIDGREVTVAAYDPQSYTDRTTYTTPVLAPAALAYRIFKANRAPVGGLHWALRGSRRYPFFLASKIYAPGARAASFECFALRPSCRPDWRYKLAGGLAHPLPRLAPGAYRLTIYAWDWTGNVSARDTRLVIR